MKSVIRSLPYDFLNFDDFSLSKQWMAFHETLTVYICICCGYAHEVLSGYPKCQMSYCILSVIRVSPAKEKLLLFECLNFKDFPSSAIT